MSEHDVIRRALHIELEFIIDKYVNVLRGLCQSPLEIIFGAVLTFSLRNVAPRQLVCCLPADEEKYADFHFLLMPQYPWKNYRIDWAIKINGADRPLIFVELDGHEFHERTKEQAARDRAKDRAAQAEDITIFRFTGSELYRDPGGCVDQVMRLINSRLPEPGK